MWTSAVRISRAAERGLRADGCRPERDAAHRSAALAQRRYADRGRRHDRAEHLDVQSHHGDVPGRRTPARLAERLRDDLRPSGGEAYLAGPLNEGTVVGGGRRNPGRADVSAAEIHGDGASVLGGEEAESWYFQTTYSEDWINAADLNGFTWDALTLADAGGGWFAGTLTMENVTAEELLPWGCALAAACWREHRLWRSGRHGTARRGRRRDFCREPQPLGLGRHPSSGVCTARRDGHDGRLWHGGATPARRALSKSPGGSFTCTGETWMQNAAMTVRGRWYL